MKHTSRLSIATTVFYAVVSVLFIGFAVYMCFFESSQIYSARSIPATFIVEDYAVREVEDASAPIGLRKEYTWTLQGVDSGEDCLAFYLVHHYAEVWLDDELMYSLTPGEDNRIGDSPSSNWVMVPLYPSDNGREVRVVVTPVYQSVANRSIDFEIGSRYVIMTHRLRADLPQIVLSGLCILLGLALMIAHPFLILRKKVATWELFFLGNFSLLIGLWRFTDTRFSSVMFSANPMAIGYITLAVLFIVCIPLLLFVKDSYVGWKKVLLLIIALLNCTVALSVLLCQLLGVAELREILVACHIMPILCVAVLLVVTLFRSQKQTGNSGLWEFIILLSAGGLSDLVYFYARGSSSGILFTILALLIYTFFRLVSNLIHINHKAYTDVKTGLFNKRRWDELMKLPCSETDPIGIIMLDLNCLKRTNDTLGHTAGDKMIYNFANILRNTIPSSNTICRWGGDEFTILISDASQEKVEGCVAAVFAAVEAYNTSGEKPEIYFAAGYALSTEFSGLSRKELLEKADQRMYVNKRQWYAEHVEYC